MTPRPKLVRPDDETRAMAARVSSVKTAYLECRTIGHAWKIVFIGPIGRADVDVQERARASMFRPDGARVLRCTRCRTERVDLCLVGYGRESYSYMLTSRAYRYPDGYAIEGGIQNHRDVIHHELFHREGDLE